MGGVSSLTIVNCQNVPVNIAGFCSGEPNAVPTSLSVRSRDIVQIDCRYDMYSALKMLPPVFEADFRLQFTVGKLSTTNATSNIYVLPSECGTEWWNTVLYSASTPPARFQPVAPQ